MTEWQSMDTAPRDGTLILVYTPDDDTFKMRVTFWYDCYYGRWYSDDDMASNTCEPVAWMPLPDCIPAMQKQDSSRG